ncbi:hypothetical protein RHOER0001_6030 [Rhodococcus erythropolis SK121]|nr:hypothetical protein RHOER0001_6030 [Rhodococcus erythropolis SK121]
MLGPAGLRGTVSLNHTHYPTYLFCPASGRESSTATTQ